MTSARGPHIDLGPFQAEEAINFALLSPLNLVFAGVIQAYVGEPIPATRALGIAAPTIITLWLLVMGILLLRPLRFRQA